MFSRMFGKCSETTVKTDSQARTLKIEMPHQIVVMAGVGCRNIAPHEIKVSKHIRL